MVRRSNPSVVDVVVGIGVAIVEAGAIVVQRQRMLDIEVPALVTACSKLFGRIRKSPIYSSKAEHFENAVLQLGSNKAGHVERFSRKWMQDHASKIQLVIEA